MPEPDVRVSQDDPSVQVQQPEPVVRFVRPEPRVVVEQAEPQVRISEAEPSVSIDAAEEAQLRVSQGEAEVNVETSGEPNVEVSQADPQVRIDEAEGADVNVEQGEAEVVVEDGEAGAQQAPQSGTDQMQGRTPTADFAARPGYEIVETDTLTVDDVTGAPVYGPNDEEIGDIGELVLDPQGQLEAAIVDVGGFLGLGERQVAIPLDQLSIQRASEGDDVRVFSDLTEEDLGAMPEYQ
jgi:hypothetical protein